MAIFKTDAGDYYVSEGDILNKRELVAVLGISRATIQRWLRKGLPCVHYANNLLGFDLKAVEAWLKEQGYPPKNLMKEWHRQKKEFRKDA